MADAPRDLGAEKAASLRHVAEFKRGDKVLAQRTANAGWQSATFLRVLPRRWTQARLGSGRSEPMPQQWDVLFDGDRLPSKVHPEWVKPPDGDSEPTG